MPLWQADYYLDTDVWREDALIKRWWRKLSKALESGRYSMNFLKKLCTKHGINILSLQSPANILRDLQSFDTRRQLAFDEFHNVGEGHGHAFYELCRLFTSEAEAVVEASWGDPSLWDPGAGEQSCLRVCATGSPVLLQLLSVPSSWW